MGEVKRVCAGVVAVKGNITNKMQRNGKMSRGKKGAGSGKEDDLK